MQSGMAVHLLKQAEQSFDPSNGPGLKTVYVCESHDRISSSSSGDLMFHSFDHPLATLRLMPNFNTTPSHAI